MVAAPTARAAHCSLDGATTLPLTNVRCANVFCYAGRSQAGPDDALTLTQENQAKKMATYDDCLAFCTNDRNCGYFEYWLHGEAPCAFYHKNMDGFYFGYFDVVGNPKQRHCAVNVNENIAFALTTDNILESECLQRCNAHLPTKCCTYDAQTKQCVQYPHVNVDVVRTVDSPDVTTALCTGKDKVDINTPDGEYTPGVTIQIMARRSKGLDNTCVGGEKCPAEKTTMRRMEISRILHASLHPSPVHTSMFKTNAAEIYRDNMRPPSNPRCSTPASGQLCLAGPCSVLEMSYFNDVASQRTLDNAGSLAMSNRNMPPVSSEDTTIAINGYSQCDPQFGTVVSMYGRFSGLATEEERPDTPVTSRQAFQRPANTRNGVLPDLWPGKVFAPPIFHAGMAETNPAYMFYDKAKACTFLNSASLPAVVDYQDFETLANTASTDDGYKDYKAMFDYHEYLKNPTQRLPPDGRSYACGDSKKPPPIAWLVPIDPVENSQYCYKLVVATNKDIFNEKVKAVWIKAGQSCMAKLKAAKSKHIDDQFRHMFNCRCDPKKFNAGVLLDPLQTKCVADGRKPEGSKPNEIFSINNCAKIDDTHQTGFFGAMGTAQKDAVSLVTGYPQMPESVEAGNARSAPGAFSSHLQVFGFIVRPEPSGNHDSGLCEDQRPNSKKFAEEFSKGLQVALNKDKQTTDGDGDPCTFKTVNGDDCDIHDGSFCKYVDKANQPCPLPPNSMFAPKKYAANHPCNLPENGPYHTWFAHLCDLNPHIDMGGIYKKAVGGQATSYLHEGLEYTEHTCHVFGNDAKGCNWLPPPQPYGMCPTLHAKSNLDTLVPAHQSALHANGVGYGLFDFMDYKCTSFHAHLDLDKGSHVSASDPKLHGASRPRPTGVLECERSLAAHANTAPYSFDGNQQKRAPAYSEYFQTRNAPNSFLYRFAAPAATCGTAEHKNMLACARGTVNVPFAFETTPDMDTLFKNKDAQVCEKGLISGCSLPANMRFVGKLVPHDAAKFVSQNMCLEDCVLWKDNTNPAKAVHPQKHRNFINANCRNTQTYTLKHGKALEATYCDFASLVNQAETLPRAVAGSMFYDTLATDGALPEMYSDDFAAQTHTLTQFEETLGCHDKKEFEAYCPKERCMPLFVEDRDETPKDEYPWFVSTERAPNAHVNGFKCYGSKPHTGTRLAAHNTPYTFHQTCDDDQKNAQKKDTGYGGPTTEYDIYPVQDKNRMFPYTPFACVCCTGACDTPSAMCPAKRTWEHFGLQPWNGHSDEHFHAKQMQNIETAAAFTGAGALFDVGYEIYKSQMDCETPAAVPLNANKQTYYTRGARQYTMLGDTPCLAWLHGVNNPTSKETSAQALNRQNEKRCRCGDNGQGMKTSLLTDIFKDAGAIKAAFHANYSTLAFDSSFRRVHLHTRQVCNAELFGETGGKANCGSLMDKKAWEKCQTNYKALAADDPIRGICTSTELASVSMAFAKHNSKFTPFSHAAPGHYFVMDTPTATATEAATKLLLAEAGPVPPWVAYAKQAGLAGSESLKVYALSRQKSMSLFAFLGENSAKVFRDGSETFASDAFRDQIKPENVADEDRAEVRPAAEWAMVPLGYPGTTSMFDRSDVVTNVHPGTRVVTEYPLLISYSGKGPARQRQYTSATDEANVCDCKKYTPIFECQDLNIAQATSVNLHITKVVTTDVDDAVKHNAFVTSCTYRWLQSGNPMDGLYIPSERAEVVVLHRDIFGEHNIADKAILDGILADNTKHGAALQALVLDDPTNDPYISPGGVAVYPGTCLRWPHGQVNLKAFRARDRQQLVSCANGTKSTKNIFGVSRQVCEYSKDVLIHYCDDVLHSPDGTSTGATASHVSCNNDAMTPEQRKDFCATNRAALDGVVGLKLRSGLEKWDTRDMCSSSTSGQVCLFVPGRPSMPTLREFFNSGYDFTNTVVVVAPFNFEQIRTALLRVPFKTGTAEPIVGYNGMASQILFDMFAKLPANIDVLYLRTKLADYKRLVCPDSNCRKAGNTGGLDSSLTKATLEEVQPKLVGTDIRIRHSGVIVTYGLEGGVLDFAGVAPDARSHTRFIIEAPNVVIDNMQADQSGCGETSHKCAAVVLSAPDVQHTAIRQLRVTGSAVAAMILGKNNFNGPANVNNSILNVVVTPGQAYAVAVAAADGLMQVHCNTGCKVLAQDLRRKHPSVAFEVNTTSKLVNVTELVDMFSDAEEREFFHRVTNMSVLTQAYVVLCWTALVATSTWFLFVYTGNHHHLKKAQAAKKAEEAGQGKATAISSQANPAQPRNQNTKKSN